MDKVMVGVFVITIMVSAIVAAGWR